MLAGTSKLMSISDNGIPALVSNLMSALPNVTLSSICKHIPNEPGVA